jgi:thymidine kinase
MNLDIRMWTGPVRSWKTAALVEALAKEDVAKSRVLLFHSVHAALRYSTEEGSGGKVMTAPPFTDHETRKSYPATIVRTSDELLDKAFFDKADVVGIEEPHFLDDGIFGVVETLARAGNRIYISALNLDFMRQPVRNTADLMTLATTINLSTGICSSCQKPSTCSRLLVPVTRVLEKAHDGDKAKIVGGPEIYCGTCWSCWRPPPTS